MPFYNDNLIYQGKKAEQICLALVGTNCNQAFVIIVD